MIVCDDTKMFVELIQEFKILNIKFKAEQILSGWKITIL